jgi:hypothetical protein
VSPVRLLPWVVHEAIEYVAGVFFLLAPFIFDLQDGPAFPVFVGVGVVILVVALLSKGPAGVLDVLPTAAHAALDYVLGFFLVLAPFIFGFSPQRPALTISMLLGVAHLVITLVTRFPQPDAEAF